MNALNTRMIRLVISTLILVAVAVVVSCAVIRPTPVQFVYPPIDDRGEHSGGGAS